MIRLLFGQNLRDSLTLFILATVVPIAVSPALLSAQTPAAQSISSVSNSETSALINQELDKKITLQLDGTLPDVLRTVSDKTGIIIRPDPWVYTLLPWGTQTTVKAKIQNASLRRGLDKVASTLGLRFVVRDDILELQPLPALRRLARRATLDEIAALDLLAATPIKLGSDHPTVSELLTEIDKQLHAVDAAYSIEDRAINQRPPAAVATRTVIEHVSVPRNASILVALDAMNDQTNSTWYPWGKTIVVLSRVDEVQYLLNRPVTARFDDENVLQVLTDLADRSGVEFTFEPGALQSVPPGFSSIKLSLDDAPVRQALDSISGFTGLTWTATPAGVHISYRAPTTQPIAPAVISP